mmetsp:Transcript_5477/g.9284  ORF Transcript_5477/g.9284 Transcript_5477/m.9284 type:complete len:105 (+) Transcript_5477:377-691(+)
MLKPGLGKAKAKAEESVDAKRVSKQRYLLSLSLDNLICIVIFLVVYSFGYKFIIEIIYWGMPLYPAPEPTNASYQIDMNNFRLLNYDQGEGAGAEGAPREADSD